MEVGYRAEPQEGYVSATRMYAPTRGSVAYALAQSAAMPMPLPYAQPEPAAQPKPAPRPVSKPKAQPLTVAGKLVVVASLLMVTVALLLLVARYAQIAEQYGVVNTLKSEIQTSELRLKQLNVALECAVSLEDAKAAAQRMGMTYPIAAQYVAVGQPLPVAASAPSDAQHEDAPSEPDNATDAL